MALPPAHRLRRLLVILFLFAMAYQVALSTSILMWLARGPDRPMPPFGISETAKVHHVSPAALSAGVRDGDELIEIDGRPYTGRALWSSELRRKHPGEMMTFVLRRDGMGPQRTLSFPVESLGELGSFNWPIIIIIFVATQFCALLLGFSVALIRPRNPLAWLLLVMMISFASFAASGDVLRDTIRTWPDGFRQAALFYHVTVGDLWPIWLLLFGLYFGGRLALDRRAPWLKWLFIAPVAAGAILDGVYHVAESESVAAASALHSLVAADPATTYMGMAAITAFFLAVWNKAYDPSRTADVRRRLRLVSWGATVALTPLFFVVLWIVALHRPLSEWITISCIVPLAVFPLTLAYVIVVHRALDVRVVIRQGLQYALAQRGVRIMQALLTMLVIGLAVWVGSQQWRRPQRLMVVAWGGLVIVFMDRGAGKLRGWIDRRFFREAHNAELILNELSDSVRTMVETLPLLQTVAHQISNSLHVTHVATLIKYGSAYRTEYAIGYETPPLLALEENGGIIARLKRECTPERVYLDNPESWIYSAERINEAERETLRALHAQLLLPLAYKDKLAGVIVLGPKQSEEPYSASDIRLLESVATQTGLALENSRLTEAVATEAAQGERLNRELEIAREVQQRLFPQCCHRLLVWTALAVAVPPWAWAAITTTDWSCPTAGWALPSAMWRERACRRRC